MGHVNLNAVDALVRGDHELLEELVRLFVEALPHDEGDLRQGLREHDLATVGALAHKWKSRFRYFGAEDLSRQSAAIEATARQSDVAALSLLVPQLIEGARQLAKELYELCPEGLPQVRLHDSVAE